MRHDATMRRKIPKPHFRYSSFCVIMRHPEDRHSTRRGTPRHLRKRGASSTGTTAHLTLPTYTFHERQHHPEGETCKEYHDDKYKLIYMIRPT